MKHEKLVEALACVSPALSSKEFVPTFTNIFVDKGKISCFNGHLFISAACDLQTTYSVPGKIFIDVVMSVSAEELEISNVGNELTLVFGKSNVTLPCEFGVKVPSFFTKDDAPLFKCSLDTSWLDLLNKVSLNASDDTSLGEMMGVLFSLNSKEARVYATDNFTLSRGIINLPRVKKGEPKRTEHVCGVPNDFIVETVKIASKYPDLSPTLSFYKTGVCIEFGDKIEIISSIFSVTPVTIATVEKAVESQLVQTKGSKFVKCPTSMPEALDRAGIVFDKTESRYQTLVEIVKGECVFTTQTGKGVTVDRIELDSKGLNVSCKIDPKLVSKAAGVYPAMKIHQRAFVFSDSTDDDVQRFIHLVGVTSSQ